MADGKASTSKSVVIGKPEAKSKTDPTGEATHQHRFDQVLENDAAGERPNPEFPGAAPLSTQHAPPVIEERVQIINGINAMLKWDQQATGDERFEICWWTHQGDRKTDLTNSSNYLIAQLKPGATYSVKVTRVKNQGTPVSGASVTVCFDTAPAKPTDLRVENLDSSPQDSITVYFSDPNENREVTHEVTVESLAGIAEPTRKVTANRCTLIDGLIPGQLYRVSVKTDDGNLTSQPAYYDADVMTYPTVPQGVDLAHEDGKLKFTWDRLNVKPLRYKVQWQANGVKKISEVDEEVFVLEKLELSTMYRFRVAAVNRAGCSCFSEEKCHQTAPAAPLNVSVRKNELMPTSSFIVKYEDPDILRKNYEIFATDLNGEVVSRARSATHTAVLNGLNPGIPHYIYVIAVYGELQSEKAYCTQNNA